MYRVYHNQTVAGAILIDDIDDGLPNKAAHRLATGDPDAYVRDGYANKPKQRCYVPRTQASAGFPLIQGYIDLYQTPRVVLSASKGKLAGLQASGLVTVASIDPQDVKPPTLSTAVLDTDLTLTGTTFVSIDPDVTTVVITGDGATTLTVDAITTASGSVSATEIVIPASLLSGVAVGTSSVKVVANARSTAVAPVVAAPPPAPTLTSVTLDASNATLAGSDFVSIAPNTTSVAFTGPGAIVLTETQITGGGGSISDTSIVIPVALIPGVTTSSSAQVTANGQTSSVVAVGP